jgi:hypothetical protein
MAEKEQEVFFAEGGRFLAPGSVGSAIQWFVRVHTYEISHGENKGKRTSSWNGAVNISDCDRKISWGLWEEDKIEKAIDELQKVLRSVRKAKRIHKQHKLSGEDDDE